MCAGTIEVGRGRRQRKGRPGLVPADPAPRWPMTIRIRPRWTRPLIIDFTNPQRGPGSRVSVELSPASARSLVYMIEAALLDGQRQHGVAV